MKPRRIWKLIVASLKVVLFPPDYLPFGEYHFVSNDYAGAITQFTAVIEKFADSILRMPWANRADVKFELDANNLLMKKSMKRSPPEFDFELEDYRLTDNVMYEVAFALRGRKNMIRQSSVGFKHADSDLAADSYFRLGEYQYDDQAFIEHYGKALESSKEQEAVLHKLSGLISGVMDSQQVKSTLQSRLPSILKELVSDAGLCRQNAFLSRVNILKL